MLKLAERTFREAARLARDRRSVVLLPLGAIEQHGPHLPLLVDWRGAEELARRIAPHLSRAGYRPILAPAVPYGVSTLAVNWGGTVSLSAPTLTRVIVEIGRRGLGLAFAGFAPGVKTPSAMLNDRVLGLMRSRRPEREWHSGELETSLMLARQPGLVRRAVARRLRPVWVDVREGLRRGARRFEQLDRGRRGYFGSPAVARAATGNKVMALRGRLIAHEVLETLSAGRPRGRSGRSAR